MWNRSGAGAAWAVHAQPDAIAMSAAAAANSRRPRIVSSALRSGLLAKQQQAPVGRYRSDRQHQGQTHYDRPGIVQNDDPGDGYLAELGIPDLDLLRELPVEVRHDIAQRF